MRNGAKRIQTREELLLLVLLPGKSHGRRSLEGCSPWGRWGSDMTERLHFHFSLSCIGEGMATHPSVLPWRIPGTGEPGGLPSMGSHRARHYWSDLAARKCGSEPWPPMWAAQSWNPRERRASWVHSPWSGHTKEIKKVLLKKDQFLGVDGLSAGTYKKVTCRDFPGHPSG